MMSKNSKVIKATKQKIYQAFTDKAALEYWLAPNGMRGKIHDFDVKVGGEFTMSLFYTDDGFKGKTADNEDRFTVKFTALQPYEKITQTITFDSKDKSFQGEMIMETSLEEVADAFTEVTIIFKNIPPGIKPEDNEAGTEQSLEKLARYLER